MTHTWQKGGEITCNFKYNDRENRGERMYQYQETKK